MTITFAFLSVLGGFALLIKGADWLVEGASIFARKVGVSDLIIGLTIVSFGTSAPELLVNVISSVQGKSDFVLGTVVGSNISNTLLILGATSILITLPVQKSTVFKEVPFSLLAALTLLVLGNDYIFNGYDISEISRGDGLVFLGFFLIFMYYTFGMHQISKKKKTHDPKSMLFAVMLFSIGIVGLAAGGKITVDGATQLAGILGLSESLIGLTVLALGTSLPELVTSMVAALKGKTDISVGNIVGSNIFNIFFVLGISSLIRPIPVNPDIINLDLIVVMASTLALFVFVHTGKLHKRILWWRQKEGHKLSRTEGIVLLASYITYIIFIGYRG